MEFGLKGTSRLVAEVTGSRHSGLGFTVFWLLTAVMTYLTTLLTWKWPDCFPLKLEAASDFYGVCRPTNVQLSAKVFKFSFEYVRIYTLCRGKVEKNCTINVSRKVIYTENIEVQPQPRCRMARLVRDTLESTRDDVVPD